jgi:plastocyanin
MLFSMVSPGPIFTSASFDPTLYTGPPMGEMKEGMESTSTAGATNATGQNQTAVAADVTISILEGASVQGNPAYDPATAEAGADQTVAWKNDDTLPHTATSEGLFDSSLISPGDSYTISAQKIGAGEHDYACTVHPYMKGKIVIK